jgi:hypothetical protein
MPFHMQLYCKFLEISNFKKRFRCVAQCQYFFQLEEVLSIDGKSLEYRRFLPWKLFI